ncbi:hypothetical protein B0H13DRAFT_1606172 [Mycena leptocephala]|nr:hypothetical protein B0H13DRAFT_1606172 [Mycena leptocephala]
MKLSNPLILSALLATSTAVAQSIAIISPVNGTSITAGQNITVEIFGEITTQGSIDGAIVIGFLECAPSGCPSPLDSFGAPLYNGPFNPVLHAGGVGPGGHGPYQNITVTVPALATVSAAQLSVVHPKLVQVRPSLFFFVNSKFAQTLWPARSAYHLGKRRC